MRFARLYTKDLRFVMFVYCNNNNKNRAVFFFIVASAYIQYNIQYCITRPIVSNTTWGDEEREKSVIFIHGPRRGVQIISLYLFNSRD